jgi:hypothetical protein
VLSLPFELRRLAAFRADVATAIGRVFVDAVASEQKRVAGVVGSQPAALDHIQRFGGSLNLNLHYHAIFTDGVFAADGEGRVRFHETGAPSREALDRIVRRVRDRVLRRLRKMRLLDERPPEQRSNEATELSAMDACAELAVRGGAFEALDPRGSAAQEDSDRRLEPKRGGGRFIADLDGFNLHAAVRIEADDDEGRERLVRYCARPCFALDRLRVLPDGRVAYRVKYAGRRGTHRVMTPVELLARLAALVAPPRYPLLRYHGVLAPHAKWRSAVVPKAPAATHAHDDPSLRPTAAGERTESPTAPTTRRAQGAVPSRKQRGAPLVPGGSHPRGSPLPVAKNLPVLLPLPNHATSPPSASEAATGAEPMKPRLAVGEVELTHQGISVRHLDRLVGGLLLATSPRVAWATLLRRTHGCDVLACGGCGGRLRVLNAITEPAIARKILDHLGWRAVPVRPRVRDPADDEFGRVGASSAAE